MDLGFHLYCFFSDSNYSIWVRWIGCGWVSVFDVQVCMPVLCGSSISSILPLSRERRIERFSVLRVLHILRYACV